jgi:hypothetical protein
MRFAEPSPIWSRLKEFQGRLDKSWQGATEQLWTRIKDLPREAARAMNFPHRLWRSEELFAE